MVSGIAWLDTSAEEQRRVRELIKLFSDQESRDELGIGQIRDVFSDALFPGTSVLLTRARYFLIVPWAFQYHAARGRSGPALRASTDKTERKLIEILRQAGYTEGLIGRVRGPSVKILPSTIYWSGLRRYRILTHDASPDGLGQHSHPNDPDADELAARVVGDWNATLPRAPEEFPWKLDGGLELNHEESSWLREQILTAVPNTLLAHLLTESHAPDSGSFAPWADPVVGTVNGTVAETLRHAELFSLAMNGAALSYNFQLGVRYEKQGYNRVVDPAQTYRDAYDDWLVEVNENARRMARWDINDFWQFVLERNPRISPSTRVFISDWLEVVRSGAATEGLDARALSQLVAQREQSVKRGQSRLTNDKLLASWSGASGQGRLTYRWNNVRRIVTDIHEGLETNAGS